MQIQETVVKAVSIPMPTRAAPITLVGVMAVALCTAMVASQFIALASTL